MSILRFLTAGESHGPALTAILEGMIAGLPVTAEMIDRDLARRQAAYGAGGRMKIEKDHVRITAGVAAGRTTGAPVGLEVANLDYPSWAERDIPPMTIPRPGHADLTGAIKYGYRDLRLALERASARETAMRVAAGAICRAYLAHFGIVVGGYVTRIGNASIGDASIRDASIRDASIGDAEMAVLESMPYDERFAAAEESDVRCPHAGAAERMRQAIREAMQAKDTLGGVFEVVALGVPPGLGSHVHFDRKLDARLAAAMLSIQAVKGVEIGRAFDNAALRGTQVHDEIILGEDGELCRATNRAGGLEGGVTTGEPIVLRVAMKPISTTLNPLMSVDLAAGAPAATKYERSDFSAAPRAVVVGEAMAAWVLAGALLEKLGGDSLSEQEPRFAALRRSRLADLPMDGTPWRFGYDA